MCLSAQANLLGKGVAEGSSAAHASPPKMPPVLQHMHAELQLPRFSEEMLVDSIMANTIETKGRNPLGCEKAYTQPQVWMHQTSGEQNSNLTSLFCSQPHKANQCAPQNRGQKLLLDCSLDHIIDCFPAFAIAPNFVGPWG